MFAFFHGYSTLCLCANWLYLTTRVIQRIVNRNTQATKRIINPNRYVTGGETGSSIVVREASIVTLTNIP